MLDPDNPYLTEQSGGEWRMFEQATSVPIDVMTEVIRADLGLAARPGPVEVTVPLVDVDPASVVTLDLATTSDVYDFAFADDGSLKAGVEDELASDGSAKRRPARRHPIRAGAAEPDPQAQPGKPRRRGDRRQRVGGIVDTAGRAVGRRGDRGRRLDTAGTPTTS